MRSRIEEMADRILDNLEESGTCVLLKWNQFAADAVADRVDGSKSGTPTAKTEEINVFLHFISPRSSSQIVQFNEIETGDVMMDYAPDVDLEGRDDLRVVIESVEYSAKPMSQKLKNAWDVVQGGVRLFRTILLKRGT